MPKYDFKCYVCKATKEIDVPVSEYYIPECCGVKMKRIFYVPNIKPGTLNPDNVAN